MNIRKSISLALIACVVSGNICFAEDINLKPNINLPGIKVDLPKTKEVDGVHSIVNDDYKAGYAMGEYISDRDYKNIIYLSVDESDISVGLNRKKGVLDALKDKGYNPKVFYTDFNQETSMQKSKEILENENPDMIICATEHSNCYNKRNKEIR